MKKDKKDPALKKKIIAAVVVIALLAAAAAIAGHVLKKPAEEPIPEAEELQPVFADPFPGSLEEAARLVNQKLILIKGDARYHVEPTEEAWSCETVIGAFTDAQNSKLKDRFDRLAKEHSADLSQEGPAAALFGALLDAGLPEAQSYTADKTDAGVFQITLSFGAQAFDGLETDDKTFSQTLDNAFGAVIENASARVLPVGLDIYAEINGYNGLLTNLRIIRKYRADASGTFTGDFADIGEGECGCFMDRSSSYRIWRDGVFVENKILQIKPGGHKNLKYTVNLPEGKTDADYTVSFRSSDPDFLTVDEKGRMDGVSASPYSAMVTVTLTFTDGTVYFDMCEVYVTVAVKGVTLTPETLVLKPEETAVLSAAVTPAVATIKDIIWLSENESVAVVDASGTVTAVAAGETKIFAVTKDGQYRKSCTVTVEGE